MSHECICGRPLAGDAICPGCSHGLQIALGNISSYWRDLDTVRARQTRYRDAGGRKGEAPLALDARFGPPEWTEETNPITGRTGWRQRTPEGTALLDVVRTTVVAWTRVVLAERPIFEGPTHPVCLHVSCARLNRSRPPADNIPSCCAYLLGHADWIRSQMWAPEILDELIDVEKQLKRMVDRPRESWYAGPCSDCEKVLYAEVGAFEVQCKDCNLAFPVKDRRAFLLKDAEDRLVPAALLARAVSWLGEDPLTSAKVRLWGHRKQITVREYVIPIGEVGPVCNLRPLYRLGDALDLMALGDRRRKRAG